MYTAESKKFISYLSFRIHDEEYAVNVASVISILELPKITRIPNAPDYIQGVFNMRGEALPVIDVHYKFGFGKAEKTSLSCILVMEILVDGKYLKLGLLVDSVKEVYQINHEDILPVPNVGDTSKVEFLSGIYPFGNDFIMIVDFEKILMFDNIRELVKVEADSLES